jgi:hypothetical protein
MLTNMYATYIIAEHMGQFSDFTHVSSDWIGLKDRARLNGLKLDMSHVHVPVHKWGLRSCPHRAKKIFENIYSFGGHPLVEFFATKWNQNIVGIHLYHAVLQLCYFAGEICKSLSRIVCRGQEGPKGTLRPNVQANIWPMLFVKKLKKLMSPQETGRR